MLLQPFRQSDTGHWNHKISLNGFRRWRYNMIWSEKLRARKCSAPRRKGIAFMLIFLLADSGVEMKSDVMQLWPIYRISLALCASLVMEIDRFTAIVVISHTGLSIWISFALLYLHEKAANELLVWQDWKTNLITKKKEYLLQRIIKLQFCLKYLFPSFSLIWILYINSIKVKCNTGHSNSYITSKGNFMINSWFPSVVIYSSYAILSSKIHLTTFAILSFTYTCIIIRGSSLS